MTVIVTFILIQILNVILIDEGVVRSRSRPGKDEKQKSTTQSVVDKNS